jgi:integrase
MTFLGLAVLLVPLPLATPLRRHALMSTTSAVVFTRWQAATCGRAPGWPEAHTGRRMRRRSRRPTAWRLEPLRPHDLRHTAVLLWIAQGVNPKHVAAPAGQTSVSFMLERYGHLVSGADDALVAGLDPAFPR